jgi:hypothetical protein
MSEPRLDLFLKKNNLTTPPVTTWPQNKTNKYEIFDLKKG